MMIRIHTEYRNIHHYDEMDEYFLNEISTKCKRSRERERERMCAYQQAAERVDFQAARIFFRLLSNISNFD